MATTKPNVQDPYAGVADPGIPAPAPDALARAFIDLLRRDAGQNARSLLQSPDPDDPVDGILDLLADPVDDEPEVTLAPDLLGATVMLARAIEEADGLLLDLRRGTPVAILEVPGAEHVSLVADALRTCALGRRTTLHNGDSWSGSGRSSTRREVALFERDGTATGHNQAKGNAAVAEALRMRMTIVGIASDPHRHLPRDLLRACEHRVALRPLDAAGVALVVEAVTDGVPSVTLNERLTRVVELSDLALAVRRDRGADGSMERLRVLLREKLASGGEGPPLEALEGYGAAKAWGLDLSADLRAYRAGTLPWAAIDKGILLSGPPGVGKTQFALALARTCEVPFLAGSLAQWQASREGHLGHCLAAMRAFFDEARKKAPCVALVDELDSFGDRTTFSHDNKDYSVQVVNAFLECLDGAASREGVVVVGATNNPGRIDPAIRRPGRLDTHVEIPRPDVAALRAILRHHLGPDVLAGEDLGPAAVAARGATGAECEAWARRAKARARREGRPTTLSDLLREIRDGAPDMSPDLRRRVAVHEAGHAVAAVALSLGRSITLGFGPDGGGLAEVEQGLDGAPTEAAVDDMLAFILAGRAAEQLEFGEVSAGSGGSPASDLATATRLALLAESRLGFGTEYPLAYFGGRGAEVRLDDLPWFAAPVTDRLARAYTAATNLLAARRSAVARVAAALDARGYLDDAEVRALVREGPGHRRRPVRDAAASPH
ncbi:AAA family ATPase [Methylobacterium sp. D54C]